jgi:hypothetical protein
MMPPEELMKFLIGVLFQCATQVEQNVSSKLDRINYG